MTNGSGMRFSRTPRVAGPICSMGACPGEAQNGSGEAGIDYQVPAEALTDPEFAAMLEEAEKYLGTPYVWGGSTPETGFDCSGYVCWVLNESAGMWAAPQPTACGSRPQKSLRQRQNPVTWYFSRAPMTPPAQAMWAFMWVMA